MDLAAYPPASGEPPSNAGLRGITAHKVYPVRALLPEPVSSYLTFSPLPRRIGVVIFCGTVSFRCFNKFRTGSRLLTGVLLFAVRTFLSPTNGRRTITRLIVGKGRFYFLLNAMDATGFTHFILKQCSVEKNECTKMLYAINWRRHQPELRCKKETIP